MMNQMNQEQLLHWIDLVSFAAIDASLYLDSHPGDEEALKYFAYYQEQRNNALTTYATHYGPLTIDTAVPSDRWYWAEQPWPWEGGCR